MLQEIITWFKTAYQTVTIFLSEYKIKNAGWLGVFLLSLILFNKCSILFLFGFVALGLFIEKNRRQLVDIYKSLKNSDTEQTSSKKTN